VTVGSRSDDDDGFFDSIAQAKQRQVDDMVAGLSKLKLKPRGTKRDEV
jgi:hypothetical protein